MCGLGILACAAAMGLLGLVLWSQADSVLRSSQSVGLTSRSTKYNEYHIIAGGLEAGAAGLAAAGVAILAVGGSRSGRRS